MYVTAETEVQVGDGRGEVEGTIVIGVDHFTILVEVVLDGDLHGVLAFSSAEDGGGEGLAGRAGELRVGDHEVGLALCHSDAEQETVAGSGGVTDADGVACRFGIGTRFIILELPSVGVACTAETIVEVDDFIFAHVEGERHGVVAAVGLWQVHDVCARSLKRGVGEVITIGERQLVLADLDGIVGEYVVEDDRHGGGSSVMAAEFVGGDDLIVVGFINGASSGVNGVASGLHETAALIE